MAPPPEYDKEPKAPDKTGTNISNEDTKLLHSLVTDQHANSDLKPSNATSTTEAENKHVETLDDGQLRALLDEAITYKCPKDREGKSSLFKELLEEVEQDEQACEEAARSLCARRGTRSRRALAHSNSLQDLVAALAAEQAPRRATRHTHHHANVSARAIHGGSLPSGVDTSSLSEEPARGGYLATVRCVNPPPLAERRVSASDANGPAETEPLNRRSKPMFPMTYTARATLEIGSGSVCSGRAVTTTTPSNQVDSAISFSCITTPEVVATCNTTSSTSQAAVVVDPKPLQLGSSYRAVTSVTGAEPPPPDTPTADLASGSAPETASDPAPTPIQGPSTPLPSRAQPRSVISSTFNGLPLSRPTYGATPTTGGDDYKVLIAYKSLDENGNSVQGFSSPLSGSSQHKKPRRKKSTKNETVIDCQQIDGYQGDKDVNELLRFIESNAEHGRGAKLGRVKHKDDADDKGGKKRSTERRKDKETKMKRATSMEELSRTKIEDLTDGEPPRPERERRADHAPAKAERRSWGDDAREARDAQPPSAAELTDFQTVTKKRKPRRRPDEPARRARPPSPRARRESAPPSDRSNDSNDDLDSVHSLPDAPKAAPAAAAPAPAPHASYADIARTRHNIPDLIESCNFYAEAGAPRRAPAVPDDYPALERRRREAAAGAQAAKGAPAAVRRDRKERPPVAADAADPAAADCPAPDVVADRRPPVVLLDSAARPRDMDGVTFGFDINEQLLGDAGGRPRCDLLRDAVAEAGPGTGAGAIAGAGHAVRVGCRALRYVPPGASPHTTHLLQIVDYVGSAWEDVVRCGTGKVRYFSE